MKLIRFFTDNFFSSINLFQKNVVKKVNLVQVSSVTMAAGGLATLLVLQNQFEGDDFIFNYDPIGAPLDNADIFFLRLFQYVSNTAVTFSQSVSAKLFSRS